MYSILLIVFLQCSVLTAADDTGVAVPKTLEDVPAYCATFVRHMLNQSIEGSNLLAQVDSWEDNITLFGNWNDNSVNDLLLSIAESYSHKSIAAFFAMSDQKRSEVFAAAITEMQTGWNEISNEEFPRKVKHPEQWSIFEAEHDAVFNRGEFIRFIIARLGFQGQARCPNTPVGCSPFGPKREKLYLLVKKESHQEFQQTCQFDLGQ